MQVIAWSDGERAWALLAIAAAAVLPIVTWSYTAPDRVGQPIFGLAFAVATGATMLAYAAFWRWRLRPARPRPDRRAVIDGRIRILDEELTSPFSGTPCVAWLGTFRHGPKFRTRAVGFVFEPLDGSTPFVLRLPSGSSAGHGWTDVGGFTGTRVVVSEHRDRICRFLRPGCLEEHHRTGRPMPTDLTIADQQVEHELCFDAGDIVTLDAVLRRSRDQPTAYRRGDALRRWVATHEIMLAKGPLARHRSLLSPRVRTRLWLFCCAGLLAEAFHYGATFLRWW